jgi:TnpA family transposase
VPKLCCAADEAVRREIHNGLNVVESWNSANGFIFFGKDLSRRIDFEPRMAA